MPRIGCCFRPRSTPRRPLAQREAPRNAASSSRSSRTISIPGSIGRKAPFVWSVIGAIAEATDQLEIGTGVTCPLIRIHPAIVAQAAATTAALMPGRFWSRTGENLNEHVLGDAWPSGEVRLDMLAEAIEIMRTLWKGEPTSPRLTRSRTLGSTRCRTSRSACSSRPESRVWRSWPGSWAGLISMARREPRRDFQTAGGADRRGSDSSRFAAEDENKARRIAQECWPTPLSAVTSARLPLPATTSRSWLVTEEQVAASVVCGPDRSPSGSDLRVRGRRPRHGTSTRSGRPGIVLRLPAARCRFAPPLWRPRGRSHDDEQGARTDDPAARAGSCRSGLRTRPRRKVVKVVSPASKLSRLGWLYERRGRRTQRAEQAAAAASMRWQRTARTWMPGR